MGFLQRPRLLAHLRTALRRGHVLVTAPAGYGKTVLLREFARQEPNTHYLALTLADSDLAYFQTRLAPLLSPHNILILDDAHFMDDAPEVREWLAEQLAQAEPRFIFASRAAPAPEQADLFTGRLDAGALAFSPDETSALLRLRGATRPLPDEGFIRAAGWALALDLFARGAAHKQSAALDDLHLLIADAAAELFETLPRELVRFMRVTAVPLRFSVELAADLLLVAQHGAEVSRPYSSPDTSRVLAQAHAQLAEIQTRNLFLETLDAAGWYRYHDLIRAALFDVSLAQRLSPRIVEWFEARGDWEMAVEHALAAGLEEQAAQLLLRVPNKFIWDQYRYRTFRRWILSLSDASHAAHPNLLIRLGREIHEIGWREEGWRYLRKGLALAEQGADHDVLLRARLSVATAYSAEWRARAALALCEQLLDDAELAVRMKERVLLVAANASSELAHFSRAREMYREALSIAETLNEPEMMAVIRYSLLARALAPLGACAASREIIRSSRVGFASDPEPGLQADTLVAECELHVQLGNWDELEARLNELDALTRGLETEWEHGQFYRQWYRAMRQVARGEYAAAQDALERAAAYASEIPDRRANLGIAHIWLARRQGTWQTAIRRADELLTQNTLPPHYRAWVALERELAAFSHAPPRADLDTALCDLIQQRAYPACVRLRALITLCLEQRGDPGWRRHFDAVVGAQQREGYADFLMRRDPDLGAAFWALAVQSGVSAEHAWRAFKVEGALLAPLLELLRAPDSRTRVRAAAVFQELERDDALPALNDALESEHDAAARRALQAAREQLEALPPPPLDVQLMGEFRVVRAGVLIPPDAWHRPIVQRLFQFFCLHRGEPLARDEILEALWSDANPANAAVTFRTVFSRLRTLLEPHLRARAPSRYFEVEGDVYRFDPSDRARVDMEQFARAVRDVLNDAARHDMPQLPDELLTALTNYRPLLPHLPLQEWLLEPRERLSTLYAEGCLYVAQAELVYDHLNDALAWADRTIQAAAWVEEAYQVQMRAHARLGNRSLALKAYSDAVTALRRELDLSPSPLTDWLAQRLRAGEEI